jgi:hypothetical protein
LGLNENAETSFLPRSALEGKKMPRQLEEHDAEGEL